MSYLSVAKAIEVLEAEKARLLAEGKPAVPEVPTAVERVFVADQPSRFAPPAPAKVEPRPRKERKRRVEQAVPQHIWIQTAKPTATDCGAIEESWFIVTGGLVFLCDASGTVSGEGRKIERNDPTGTARQMLRSKRMARPGEPYHGRLTYPVLKY